MTSTRQKTFNRLSSIFLPNTKPADIPTASINSSSSDSSLRNKVRKSSAPVLTEMKFSGSWPLPEQAANSEPLPTVIEPRHISEDAPQISASPEEELPQLDFGMHSPEPIIQNNPAHHRVPPYTTTQRPRSASSNAAPTFNPNFSQGHDIASNASLNPGSIMSNDYGNHSSTDLLKPKKQSLLLKRQKSENALRHNTAPVHTGNRAVSTSLQPSRSALTPPMPQLSSQLQKAPPSSAMSGQSIPLSSTAQPKKSKSWLFGGSSTRQKNTKEFFAPAWIAGVGEKVPYDLNNLISGAKVRFSSSMTFIKS
jgi:hypothetical protein